MARSTRVSALLSLLAILGCSNRAEVTAPERVAEPAAIDCPSATGYCFAVQFKGFPEYSEDPIVFLEGVPGVAGYNQEDIVHPELENAFASVSWSGNSSCHNSFTYMDPYSDYGGVLFPPGSKYEKFSLSWNLLCADIKPCNQIPWFFDIRELYWGGKELAIHDSLGNVIPNQAFSLHERGKGPATLHVAEVLEDSTGMVVRGVRLELPGKKEVLISVTSQTCP